MSQKDDIPVFPVSGWQAGPLPGYSALALKFQFLSSPMQPMETAQETQFFALTPEMTEALISDLRRHIETLKKSGIHSPQGETH
ncbi:bssS family protein [Salmonella enterica subsp. enterica serovar Hermannswerder]|nr:bssS family protein [Salmonella enterica subsp. diarizonae]EDW1164188.1 bssS family protein [Salmonella enterica subsp. enterica]EGI6167663.1 bssS family protein [Salmonella enterica subsp. enterica serovar Hermannswerder]HAF3701474.1 bssS family protein [Salmonella enterica]ECJ2856719.1 bssS family protein [Salmonella enterica subsp. diarizonae]